MVFKKLGLDPEPDPDSPLKPKGLDPGSASVNTGIDPKACDIVAPILCAFNTANINFRYRRRQYGWTRMGAGAAHRASPRKGERKRRKVNDLARKHRTSRVGNYCIRAHGTGYRLIRYSTYTVPIDACPHS
jgi:hypothetical protein